MHDLVRMRGLSLAAMLLFGCADGAVHEPAVEPDGTSAALAGSAADSTSEPLADWSADRAAAVDRAVQPRTEDESASARAHLEQLQSTYRTQRVANTNALSRTLAGRALLQRERAAAAAGAQAQRAQAQRAQVSALPQGSVRYERAGAWLRPLQEGTAGEVAPAVDLALPHKASGAFRLAARESAIALEAKLQGARDVDGEVAGGYVVYQNGGPEGSTLLQRATDNGTEDYVSFERAPSKPEVVYEVALSEGVAGLRLVANTLELLDAQGDPKLRIAPPYLIGADGKHVDAALAVRGCDVDTNPAEPWGRPTVHPGAERCNVHVSWDNTAVAYPALLDPSWSNTASMSTPRASFAIGVLSNNNVLVCGGLNASWTALASAEVYNPTTGTWAATGAMPAARSLHVGVILASQRILIVGGQSSTGAPMNAALQYSRLTGVFTSAGTMTTARSNGHTATLLTNDKILVTGGFGTSGILSSAELYTPPASTGTGSWATTANMLAAHADHAAVRLTTGSLSGRVLVIGDSAPSAQLYNPTNGTWAATTALNVPRDAGAAVVLNDGKVLYAGGADDGVGSGNTAEVFDPNVSPPTWRRVGSLRYGRPYPTATLLSDGKVLVTGVGLFITPDGTTSAEVFNPTYGTWAPAPNAARVRITGHAARRLSTGRVLVVGGFDLAFTPQANAELFDATTPATTAADYRYTAAMDPTVTDVRPTEIWGTLYRPTTLAAGRYPLLVFMHGNHRTCGGGSNPRVDDSWEYTTTGTCPAGKIPVPSQAGYAYLAHELAARGYIVASINVNRINHNTWGPADDQGMNLARGRLLLKHLMRISEWDRSVTATPAAIGVSLANKIDFTQVGLMGHSRGGEGIRAAYQQYRDSGSPWPGRIVSPVTFRGLFEIGPVDRQTSRVLNAEGTQWAVLLPMCDGDVMDLQGVQPFDRMFHGLWLFETPPSFKASYTVYGANHNYYNTEWQQHEGFCSGHRELFLPNGPGVTGSAEQRQTALTPILSFFLGNVQPKGGSVDPSRSNLFDPRYPGVINPRVDRGYNVAWEQAVHSTALEDFVSPSGTSSFGLANVTSANVTVSHEVLPEHEWDLHRGARIQWNASNTFFQSTFPSSGLNLTGYQYLDLRVDRLQSTLNTTDSSSVTVRLVNSNGTLSSGSANVEEFIAFDGPVGGFGTHSMLQTVRIPLTRFNATLNAVRGVRLTFNDPSGLIGVANIRAADGNTFGTSPSLAAASVESSAARTAGANLAASDAPVPPGLAPAGAAAPPVALPQAAFRAPPVVSGSVASLRSAGNGTSVEIEVRSSEPIVIGDELIALHVGSARPPLVRSSDDGRTLVYSLARSDFDAQVNGAAIVARRGLSPSAPVGWSFGTLDKTRLDR